MGLLTDRIRSMCAEMRTDVEIDVRALDGREFNGVTVADMFSRQAAAIDGLANLVSLLADVADAQHEAYRHLAEQVTTSNQLVVDAFKVA